MTTKSTQIAVIETAADAKEMLLDIKAAASYLSAYRADVINTVVNSDMSVKKNQAAVRSLAAAIPRRKTQLDNWGKELVEPLKAQAKKVDAVRKLIREELDSLRDDVRKPLTEWENAEKARIASHQEMIERIGALANAGDQELTSDDLKERLATLEAFDLNPELWEEFHEEANDVFGTTIVKVKAMLATREKYEAEQAELAVLRESALKREQEDRERRIAEEATQKAKADAKAKYQREQHQAQLESDRRERERLEAIEREKLAEQRAEQAEKQRIHDAEQAAIREREAEERRQIELKQAEEQRKLDTEAAERRAQQAAKEAEDRERARQVAEQQRIEAENAARLANQEHVSSILGGIKTAIMAYEVDESTARAIVLAMKNNAIPNVKVMF